MIRTIAYSITLMLLLSMAQSRVPVTNVLTNAVEAKSSKPLAKSLAKPLTKSSVKSPYKKSFKRSKRKRSKSHRRSSSGSCILWSANKINEKANPYKSFINNSSRKYRIDRNLIKAIITAESCFRVKAKSHKHAQGLMQLIPATAERFGVKDSYKPQQNIRGGTKYLRFLMDRFNGDLKKVIASYNAGEGAVERHKGIPPYKETIQYVKNVLQVYAVLNPPKPLAVKFTPPKKGLKAGRQGWQYNRSVAPHLFKQ